MKKKLTIYHVHFLSKDEKESDYYFGSISAIFDYFNKEEIGIQASSLYNLNLDEVSNSLYENKKCRIRKSILLTKAKQNS